MRFISFLVLRDQTERTMDMEVLDKIPMAEKCSRSPSADQAGIPVADGRAFRRSAKGHTAISQTGQELISLKATFHVRPARNS